MLSIEKIDRDKALRYVSKAIGECDMPMVNPDGLHFVLDFHKRSDKRVLTELSSNTLCFITGLVIGGVVVFILTRL